MNIITIIGIIAGFALVYYGIITDSDISAFINVSGILITVGGTVCAMIASTTLDKFLQSIISLKVIFRKKNNLNKTIEKMVELSTKARHMGLLALEEDNNISDKFMKKGLELVIDGVDSEQIREILESDITSTENRHSAVWRVYFAGASYAPSFGMIGTLIGLVSMLKTLNDPSTLGAGMSTALITTFYGVLLANLLFNPIAKSLMIISNEETAYKEIVLEGLLFIQAGTSPYIVKQSLNSYLPEKQRYTENKNKSKSVKNKNNDKPAMMPKKKLFKIKERL